MIDVASIRQGSHLESLVKGLLDLWPEHEKFLHKSFQDRDDVEIELSHELADLIARITEGTPGDFFRSYKWTCEQLNAEEIYFRRNNTYRHTKVSDVMDFVYGNAEYMTRYVQGLLLSQIFWRNHVGALSYMKTKLLEKQDEGFSHLEIGPGHGLLLYLAASHPHCVYAEGWDISEASVVETKKCLHRMGSLGNTALRLQDANLVPSESREFDSIVLSEVLEHVEDPKTLLLNIQQRLSKKGKLYINVPVNCPAPDHIYLLRSTEEASSLIMSAGLTINDYKYIPMTGFSLERAEKLSATISCVFVASKA